MFKQKSNMKKDYKIWIARDEAECDEDGCCSRGAIHLFYDTPQLVFNKEKRLYCWENARKIATIPSYMFPELKETSCVVFKEDKK